MTPSRSHPRPAVIPGFVLLAALVAFLCSAAPASASTFGITTTTPTDGATVAGQITWQVAPVSGSSNPSKVKFYIDGVLMITDTSAPFYYGSTPGGLDTTTLADGTHLLKAVATRAKSTSTSQVSVSVLNNVLAPPLSAEPPTISGLLQDGQTLQASTGSWRGSMPMGFDYQWQDCDSSGANCVAIAGAVSASYQLAPGDVGKTIRAVVTASNVLGSSSASSAETPLVADATAPTAPGGLAATSVGASSASLGWAVSSDDVGVAGYNVFVNGVLSGTTSSTAYTLSSLACGTTYAFGVQAFDAAGNLSPLATLSVPTAACATAPPPSSVTCTKTLAAGGDLSTFVSSLKPGDVGCLHGGTYTDGTIVTWTASGTSAAPVTVTEYPGEQAEIVGTTFYLDGSYQIMRNLTVRDVTCTDCDGIAVSGSGNRVDHNVVYNVWRQGILLHTDSANAVIVGNDVHDTGQTGSNQHHGIYVQGNGHLVINNVFAQMRGGYGIHVYPSSSNVVVAQNTVVGSQTRSGILIDSTGGNITVVNNILVGNAEYGVLNRRCDLGGCLVDHNLAWNNGYGATSGPASNTIQADPQFTDSTYHLAGTSPAVNSARSDYSYSPDRDGSSRPQGGGPDLGAYER